MFSEDEVIVYHNPRCSKSRATLELLRARGIQPRIVEYLKAPPTVDELGEVLTRLGAQPRDIIRSKEPEYRRAGLDNPSLTSAALIELMRENPKVIERPIVIANGKAALGRPPESVLEIL